MEVACVDDPCDETQKQEKRNPNGSSQARHLFHAQFQTTYDDLIPVMADSGNATETELSPS